MLLPHTICRRADRTTSLAIVLIWIAACCIFVLTTEIPASSDPAAPTIQGRNDLALYQAVVARIETGESYYAALGDELHTREYPLSPVFNWRTPLHLNFLAALPTGLVQAMALALALLALCLQMRWADICCIPKSFSYLSAALVAPALCVVAHPMAMYFAEFWAGLFIWTSICCFGCRFNYLGSAAAIAALFFRELAAIYVLVLLFIALQERNKRELTMLGVGLAAYAGYYYLHFLAVEDAIGVFDQTQQRNWLAFGGAAFLQNTVGMYPLLMIAPAWLKAVTLPTALLGAFACPLASAKRAKLALGCYVLFFSMAGLPFNYYWGALYIAAVIWGAAWFIALAADLGGNILQREDQALLAGHQSPSER